MLFFGAGILTEFVFGAYWEIIAVFTAQTFKSFRENPAVYIPAGIYNAVFKSCNLSGFKIFFKDFSIFKVKKKCFY